MTVSTTETWLREALGLPEGATPFPWQERLFTHFVNERLERSSLDIPTGLGKTAVMAIWLVARACNATLPRRLVYVVDRRAVVDQATEVAEGLREFVARNLELKQALGLGERSLPISTLRGQHVDNKEWLEDPASPAIIVGTVDMVGSRLLFEGYRTTRKMRPYHAGLLGVDTLVVLDEAHLVPPFEKLLETVAEGGAVFVPRDEALRKLVPPFKLLSLSATGRARAGTSFVLQDTDLQHLIVQRRLDARKHLTVHTLEQTKLADTLAERAWELAGSGTRPVRCIIFCNRREDAAATQDAIEKCDKNKGTVDIELFVGGRRVFEREAAAERLKKLGFIAGSKVERTRAAFVIATSAGEVGVDLDADHMVSDLVAWERMVQRLGRVNRRGEGEASVVVVVEPKPAEFEDAARKLPGDRTKKESKAVESHEARNAWARALACLPPLTDGGFDASPGAIRALKQRAEADQALQAILDAATTPPPLRPALSRALVDAWSMTSLREHTGRPEIDPWLRGWVEEDPQTAVVWRTHLPVRTKGSAATNAEIEAFFEAAPPHASEVLEAETFRVVEWLLARDAKALAAASHGQEQTSATLAEGENDESALLRPGDVVAFVLTAAGDLHKVVKLGDLTRHDTKQAGKKQTEHLRRDLAGATLVVDARLRGLAKNGLLDPAAEHLPPTVDDGAPWGSAGDADINTAGLSPATPMVRFRVQSVEAGQSLVLNTKLWRERLRFITAVSDNGEPQRWLVVHKWRHDAATEEDRSAGRPQLLDEHHTWTEEHARNLARRLGLPEAYVEMLATAARLHDMGKRARRWQRAFNADDDGLFYAKTRGPLNNALLDGYRHEFGSLPYAEKDTRLLELPEDLRELALHLIAAHHGFARPIIGTSGCEEPPSVSEERAREVSLRFARLQKRCGPWGLAWWEALLRAADQQASRDNDAVDSTSAQEGDP